MHPTSGRVLVLAAWGRISATVVVCTMPSLLAVIVSLQVRLAVYMAVLTVNVEEALITSDRLHGVKVS